MKLLIHFRHTEPFCDINLYSLSSGCFANFELSWCLQRKTLIEEDPRKLRLCSGMQCDVYFYKTAQYSLEPVINNGDLKSSTIMKAVFLHLVVILIQKS